MEIGNFLYFIWRRKSNYLFNKYLGFKIYPFIYIRVNSVVLHMKKNYFLSFSLSCVRAHKLLPHRTISCSFLPHTIVVHRHSWSPTITRFTADLFVHRRQAPSRMQLSSRSRPLASGRLSSVAICLWSFTATVRCQSSNV